MNTADLGIYAASVTVPWVIAVVAGWHLVRTGRVRLSAPSPAQLQAERDTSDGSTAS